MTDSNSLLVTSERVPDAMINALSQVAPARRGHISSAGLGGARVYISTALDPVSADLIDTMPDSIGLIANIGVGTNNIDIDAASRRGMQVSNTPVVTEDTADLTMALLLATCRRLTRAEGLLRAGNFLAAQGEPGLRVHGKTLGIVGFGAIGQAVAKRAAGFDMKILYHGPRRKQDAEGATGAGFHEKLASLLAEADIVSLNCPLNGETRHLMNARTIRQMKPDAVLINTGRGALIHEQALADALEDGHLGGAGLDVFEFEPEVTPQLLGFDNVTLLPHIGSATGECRQDMAMRVIANIRAYLETGRVLDPCC